MSILHQSVPLGDGDYRDLGLTSTNGFGVTHPRFDDVLSSGNYVLAPPLVEHFPDSWGMSTWRGFDVPPPVACVVACEPQPVQPIPEPNYALGLGAAMVLMALSRRCVR